MSNGSISAVLTDAANTGIATCLEALARRDPWFLGFIMLLLACFYCMPVLVSATRLRGAYVHLLAMQDIRCLVGAGIVHRANVIPGLRRNSNTFDIAFFESKGLPAYSARV